jgi:nucleoside-diphosphate-sugar epimerase
VFAATNLLAAKLAGTRRVVAQGHNFIYEQSGGPVKSEDDPLVERPIPSAARTIAAIRYVDRTVPLEVPEGIVLRYGTFYGPGASESLLDPLRKRQLPVIGGGTGIWSFIEITDAAAATLAAIEHGEHGVYNVVDSDPRPLRSGCRTWPR